MWGTRHQARARARRRYVGARFTGCTEFRRSCDGHNSGDRSKHSLNGIIAVNPCHRIGPPSNLVDNRIGLEAIDSVIDYPYGYSQTDWRQQQDQKNNPCWRHSVGLWIVVSSGRLSGNLILQKISCAEPSFIIQIVSTNRSPNWIANCASAACHSLGCFFHFAFLRLRRQLNAVSAPTPLPGGEPEVGREFLRARHIGPLRPLAASPRWRKESPRPGRDHRLTRPGTEP